MIRIPLSILSADRDRAVLNRTEVAADFDFLPSRGRYGRDAALPECSEGGKLFGLTAARLDRSVGAGSSEFNLSREMKWRLDLWRRSNRLKPAKRLRNRFGCAKFRERGG